VTPLSTTPTSPQPGDSGALVPGLPDPELDPARPAPVPPTVANAPVEPTGTATTVARNASVLAAAMVVSRVAAFALAVAMGRELGALQYGRYGFANALATILVPIADIGLTTYLTREVARARGSAEAALGTMLRTKVALALAVAVLVGGGAVLLSHNATTIAIVLLVLVAALADGLSLFVFGYFRGRERMGLEGKLTAGSSLARSLVGIGLVLATGELVPLLIWMLTVSGAQLGYGLVRLRRSTASAPAVERRASSSIDWRTVATIGSFTILTIIYTRADSVLVGWIEDERAVGLYTAAYTIMLGLQILPWMIGTALVPVFARTHVTERDVFESAWHQGIRAVLVIAFPLSLLVSLLATPIMKQVFGPEFARGGAALAIVIWAGPLAGFNTIIAGVLRGARREAWLTSTAALGVLLNVGLNLWAIPVYGIAGAAATTVGTEILIALTLAALAIRNRVVPVPRGPYLGLALALAALAGVALGTRGLPLILTIPASLAVYAAVAILARVVGRSDLELAGRVVASRKS